MSSDGMHNPIGYFDRRRKAPIKLEVNHPISLAQAASKSTKLPQLLSATLDFRSDANETGIHCQAHFTLEVFEDVETQFGHAGQLRSGYSRKDCPGASFGHSSSCQREGRILGGNRKIDAMLSRNCSKVRPEFAIAFESRQIHVGKNA